MDKKEIISRAYKIVSSLGNEIKGKKKDHEEKVVVESTYEGFGFKISFLESSREKCVIIFDGDVVFSNIQDEYDPSLYECQSPILMMSHGAVFVQGDWEEGLLKISDNTEKIKEKIAQLKKETKQNQKFIDDLNEQIMLHIPFKFKRYLGESKGIYKDNMVQIFYDDDDKTRIIVSGKEVFNALYHVYVSGPWENHVLEIIQKNKEKYRAEAIRHGYNPDTLEKEMKKATVAKTSVDYLAEIDKFI